MFRPRPQPASLGLRFPLATVCTLCLFFLVLYHVWGLDGRTLFVARPQRARIPKKIWYKLGPNGLNADTQRWTDSCIGANPDYEHTFLTDESGDAYVAATFSSRPDLVSSYLDLKVPILKADLLRYLLLFAEGGVWSDLDVSCESAVPMREWVPLKYRDVAGLVVGWEFDVV